MKPKTALIAAACGVLFSTGTAHAADDPTYHNCFVKGNGLCGGASLNGQHIIVTRGRPYHIRLYWPFPTNLVTTFRTSCARPRGATVIRAKVGATDHAWIRTCEHTYKVGIS
jgi:hypothetical protein